VRRRTSAARAQSTRHETTAPELKKNDELIALEYLANGYNATAAYRSVHPKCSQRTAEVNGSRLLRKAEVRAFIVHEQKERKKRLRVDADEALEGITRHARADIRQLFKDGKLIPIDQWPEEIADSVKAIKHTPFGPTIVMYDKLRARELMAMADGVLRQKQQHNACPSHRENR
jgi:phage terminase small subunit